MAEAAEGILSEDGVGLQQPATVASELASSEAAVTPAAAPREEFVQNAVAFLSHPKVLFAVALVTIDQGTFRSTSFWPGAGFQPGIQGSIPRAQGPERR